MVFDNPVTLPSQTRKESRPFYKKFLPNFMSATERLSAFASGIQSSGAWRATRRLPMPRSCCRSRCKLVLHGNPFRPAFGAVRAVGRPSPPPRGSCGTGSSAEPAGTRTEASVAGKSGRPAASGPRRPLAVVGWAGMSIRAGEPVRTASWPSGRIVCGCLQLSRLYPLPMVCSVFHPRCNPYGCRFYRDLKRGCRCKPASIQKYRPRFQTRSCPPEAE
jgi:hypothetical protein